MKWCNLVWLTPLFGLQVLDVWTTNVLIEYEINPVVVLAVAWLGSWWWLIKLLLVVPWIVFVLRREVWVFRWPLGVMTGAYALIVVNNLVSLVWMAAG